MKVEYINRVIYDVELRKDNEIQFQTDDIDEATNGQTFAELYDDMLQFLSDVPKGKISLENIVRKAKDLHERLDEWEFMCETSKPEWASFEQERDEDDFVNDNDL